MSGCSYTINVNLHANAGAVFLGVFIIGGACYIFHESLKHGPESVEIIKAFRIKNSPLPAQAQAAVISA